ncbi:105-kDa kinase-like protein, putative [Brugia malayi]|uniref:105-kDa kinase-like protein, putative n=1 Tax=Brugia malayi TaxID=6279 RepID=A0A4E9F0D0_BRUMA|nr:105-kDa kinase-like protein, putative [Brugia malayi]VIO90035.1 105-kDa kinase-like protein, putative [Brugia malayi]
MTSVLSSLFSRDPKSVFPYELPASSFYTFDGIYIGKSFKKAEPSELATCFWATVSDYGPGSVLKAQARKLKTLRHPNVLAYLDSVEMNGTFYLITEACVPLKTYITENKLTDKQKDFVVSWGLFQLLSCLKFLHQEAELSHENIRYSVYVTESGDWKLGGFEKSTVFSNPCTDLNSFALLTWEIFNGFNESITKPEAPKRVPQQLHVHYKKMATNRAAKLNTGELLRELRQTGGFFKNRYVDILLFLDEFQLKDAHEKQAFFTELKNELDFFPDNIAKYRILPKLIHSYEYGDAGSHVLMPLFRLGRLLDENEYQLRIVPCLCKLFSSPDRVTRVKLLERIDEFAPHLTPQIVNDRIYKNVASGFMDTNPAVRESTVKAMVSLADKLNNQNLNTDLMRHLARLQGADDQPGIRTNATICLGKIGCYIDPSHRQQILISAFTRALKDPFPPARMAAILALSATQQYYSLIEVANRILPALSPVTCDQEKQVRDQSFKALYGFIEKLEKASENPELIAELESQVKAGGKSGLLSSDKVPQWASWALKSLSGKFYSSSMQNQSGSAPKQEAPICESKSNTKTSSELKSYDTAPEKFANDDGWGELEDNLAAENEDEWEDANDVLIINATNINERYDNEQREVIAAKSKPSTTTSSKPFGKTSGTKGLKLQRPFLKSTGEDDLNCLLGIKSKSSADDNEVTNRNTFAVKNSSDTLTDGWSDNFSTSGWDDFDVSSGGISTEVMEDGEWNISWNADEPVEISSISESKDVHQAKNAARNKAHNMEMARKRTTRVISNNDESIH